MYKPFLQDKRVITGCYRWQSWVGHFRAPAFILFSSSCLVTKFIIATVTMPAIKVWKTDKQTTPFSLNEHLVGWPLHMGTSELFFSFFPLSPEEIPNESFGVKWGKGSFQHLHGGMWARHFRQDVTVPPGNRMPLIRISRQIWVYVWMLQFWSNVYTAEGKGEQRYWGEKGSGLV